MIYFIEAIGQDAVKIGYTLDQVSLLGRLRSLQTGSNTKLRILHSVSGDQAAEHAIHFMFKDHHMHGEWFRLSGVIKSLWDIVSALTPQKPKSEDYSNLPPKYDDYLLGVMVGAAKFG